MVRRERGLTMAERRLEHEWRKFLVLTIVNLIVNIVAAIAAVIVAIYGR